MSAQALPINTNLDASGLTTNNGHTYPTIRNSQEVENGHQRNIYAHPNVNLSQPGFPIYSRPRANPAPLGLFAFASTTLLLSLINVHARHVIEPNMVVGMAFAFGGLGQFVAGIFEFCVGNTFGMTAFCGYGAFWLSIGLMFWPSSGILAAYETAGSNAYSLDAALGLFMITWFIFTLLLFLATFRSSAGLVSLFFLLIITFLVLAIGYFRASVKVIKAGGYLGIITSLIAYYVAAHSLLTAEAAPFSIPNPSLARKGV